MPKSKSRRKGKKSRGRPVRRPAQRELDFEDALYEAQELAYEAWEEDDPERQVELAIRALEISPYCADAYLILSRHLEPVSDQRLECLHRAVESGKTVLGEDALESGEDNLWSYLEARPYLRARLELALELWDRGDKGESLGHLHELLRLSPNDNQGVRYILMNFLLDEGRDDDVSRLLNDFPDDASAHWLYGAALLAFRKRGDDEDSRRLLAEAVDWNGDVLGYLMGLRRMPDERPLLIEPGGESEAIEYAAEAGNAWRRTDGALDWLRRCSSGQSRRG